MNHLIALAITITAFSSGLYGIYKFFRAKYVSYDTKPIHYWSNRKQKIKKRYKTFRKFLFWLIYEEFFRHQVFKWPQCCSNG